MGGAPPKGAPSVKPPLQSFSVGKREALKASRYELTNGPLLGP